METGEGAMETEKATTEEGVVKMGEDAGEGRRRDGDNKT